MRKLTCKAITGWECDFEAEADLNTAVKSKLRSHIASVHAKELKEMDEEARKAALAAHEKAMSSALPAI